MQGRCLGLEIRFEGTERPRPPAAALLAPLKQMLEQVEMLEACHLAAQRRLMSANNAE